jgi:deoxyhypusine synthase
MGDEDVSKGKSVRDVVKLFNRKKRSFDKEIRKTGFSPNKSASELARGFDRYKKSILKREVKQLDLEKTSTISDLVESFKRMSIQGRNIGLCAQVYEDMLHDKDRPTIILGLSGALIAGGLRKVIRDMIHYGMVDVVVSTGAVLYQDFFQARGHRHYMGSPSMDDETLDLLNIDRIYDTLVDDEFFVETDRVIWKLAEKLEPRAYSSREITALLGKEVRDPNSILHTAYKKGIPVFSPALNDSSIGIGLTEYYIANADKERMTLDAIKDNYEMVQIVINSRETGVIYTGGGVPKNWINDSEVMAEYSYLKNRFGKSIHGHKYAFQITTDAPQWGALSGSTLEEAESWGKIDERASKATAYVEATIALPLIVGHILQKGAWKNRKRLLFKWKENGGGLKEIRTV